MQKFLEFVATVQKFLESWKVLDVLPNKGAVWMDLGIKVTKLTDFNFHCTAHMAQIS